MKHEHSFGNFFNDLPAVLDEEIFESIVERDGVKIERIVSSGQASPEGFWYEQPAHEWVIVLRGRARLLIEGRTDPLELGPGDHVDLPARCRHRVEWTTPDEPTIWLAVHFEARSPS